MACERLCALITRPIVYCKDRGGVSDGSKEVCHGSRASSNYCTTDPTRSFINFDSRKRHDVQRGKCKGSRKSGGVLTLRCCQLGDGQGNIGLKRLGFGIRMVKWRFFILFWSIHKINKYLNWIFTGKCHYLDI